MADEPFVCQILPVKKGGVQGIAGGRAVGRAGRVRRSQRQDLPDPDVVLCQKMKPTPAGFPEAAAYGTTRECGRMEKHSCASTIAGRC